MFPVKDLSSLIILLCTLNPSILGFYESIPICPIGILHLYVPIFIGISLLKANKLIEISKHINEDTTVTPPLEKVLESELYAICRFEKIDHLADDILEIEI